MMPEGWRADIIRSQMRPNARLSSRRARSWPEEASRLLARKPIGRQAVCWHASLSACRNRPDRSDDAIARHRNPRQVGTRRALAALLSGLPKGLLANRRLSPASAGHRHPIPSCCLAFIETAIRQVQHPIERWRDLR
jgi:type IV pilus biogenesis protein CpaD/CtpE